MTQLPVTMDAMIERLADEVPQSVSRQTILQWSSRTASTTSQEHRSPTYPS